LTRRFVASRKRFALSAASTVALMAYAAQPAWAQEAPAVGPAAPAAEDAPPANPDDVVVTGFRQSLQKAQKRKRDADTVVDVITAEDIGALPDRSVAESLQRVPGVNISRFEQRNDPDRFSVEGSGVIIRGLPFVRSELNGRDIFSANGGRELSFNDVSAELLGRVEVFKNTTADMIDGGISGTVNLVTRKPLENRGLHVAGALEVNYGDMAKKWSPGFSLLGSNTWDGGAGTFGLQLAYSQSNLKTKTDASQITDPCYRAASLDGPCLRIRPVGSGGISGGFNFDPDNFPPAGSVIVPKGAGVRTTDLDRDRKAYSAVGQWQSNDRRMRLTLEFLRAETKAKLSEHAILALVNDDNLFPIPADTWQFDGDVFESGTLTQAGFGIPTELLRFQRKDRAMTQDISAKFEYSPTDRLRLNFEGQKIKSNRFENGLISAMQTYTDVAIDNSGNTPLVQFLQPTTTSSPSAYFNDPTKTFYWFLLDNRVHNEGGLKSLRGDAEYEVSDTGFFKKARFGARWGDRDRVTRNANFSNWGNLGAPWTGRNGNWNCDDAQAFGCGGAYVSDFPSYSQIQNPFGDDFQRGSVPVPIGDGSAFFFGGDDMVADYLSGLTQEQANTLTAFSLTPNAWRQIADRQGLVDGLPWTPGEISDVGEKTKAAYIRVDFGRDFGTMKLDGNIGVRYVDTVIKSGGQISYPIGTDFDTNNDGVVTQAEVAADCATVQPGQTAPGYCSLSPARQAEFASVFTGEVVNDDADIKFHDWLPSFNAKLDVGHGLLFRVAVSKGISRPDLNAFATGGAIFDNSGNLQSSGTLETGPLFQIFTGNRLLRPVRSWNYDLSAEWYFSNVGSLTLALFRKDLRSIVNSGQNVRSFTSPSGVTTDVAVNGPVNADEGKIKGFELAYQQTYDFLPGLLSGFGTQFTYTYVDSKVGNSTLGAEQSPFASDLPLAGVSKHTINAVAFYEKGPLSARVAYNWRSKYLQTPRDVIFPFSPIYGESTGQLDASVFYSINSKVKIGVQGVNLLDEVTRTGQVIDFDGTRITRSAFRNDRRFTFLTRFSF
jgi:TonB-dependent receptor